MEKEFVKGEFYINGNSDKGCRAENQDSYWWSIFEIDNALVAFVCVCDGMGGLEDGKNASLVIKETIKDSVKNDGYLTTLTDDVLKTARGIYVKATESGQRSGTTCTILICSQGVYKVYHIGDSRCYRFDSKDNKVYQITRDHTMIDAYKEKLYELEHADPATDPHAKEKHEKARYNKIAWRNQLTRCLGASENPEFDELSGEYNAGDKFLVCSDGFWHYIKGMDFIDNSFDDLPQKMQEFIGLGESDNLTAVQLEIKAS